MPEIITCNGVAVLIDEEDVELVSRFKWRAEKDGNVWYANAATWVWAKKSGYWSMHRLIMAAERGAVVDHKNGDGLDNRRSNLRIATEAQNHQNRVHTHGTSGYRGVTFHKSAGKWQASVKMRHGGKLRNYYLGLFVNPEDAARAYDRKAVELFGEFARPNFPNEVMG